MEVFLMKQYTVEFDEMTCKWLLQISELTGNPVEKVIADAIYNSITAIEDILCKHFTYSEK